MLMRPSRSSRLEAAERTAAWESATRNWSRPSRAASMTGGVFDVGAEDVGDEATDEGEFLGAFA